MLLKEIRITTDVPFVEIELCPLRAGGCVQEKGYVVREGKVMKLRKGSMGLLCIFLSCTFIWCIFNYLAVCHGYVNRQEEYKSFEDNRTHVFTLNGSVSSPRQITFVTS